jgi:hypothetical protein
MSDPAIVAIVSKTILCSLLLLGGILSIVFGYRVFRHHAEAARSRMVLNVMGLKVTSEGAGAVIAAQAVAWAWFGFHASPNYVTTREETKVYSFVTSAGSVQAPALKAVTVRDVSPTDLKAAFANALQSEKNSDYKIAGVPAVVDYSSIEQVIRGGVTYLKADLKSPGVTAEVQYKPLSLDKSVQWSSGKVVFEPSLATVKGWKNP